MQKSRRRPKNPRRGKITENLIICLFISISSHYYFLMFCILVSGNAHSNLHCTNSNHEQLLQCCVLVIFRSSNLVMQYSVLRQALRPATKTDRLDNDKSQKSGAFVLSLSRTSVNQTIETRQKKKSRRQNPIPPSVSRADRQKSETLQ